MTTPLSPTYTLVTQYPQFLDLCSTLERCDRIAIDTEADSMHHYPERVCLVQVATPQSTYLLDPLALVDLSPLGPALSSPRVLKLLHGADYDVRGLNRDWGLTISNLFDTHIAARFLGLERVGSPRYCWTCWVSTYPRTAGSSGLIGPSVRWTTARWSTPPPTSVTSSTYTTS